MALLPIDDNDLRTLRTAIRQSARVPGGAFVAVGIIGNKYDVLLLDADHMIIEGHAHDKLDRAIEQLLIGPLNDDELPSRGTFGIPGVTQEDPR